MVEIEGELVAFIAALPHADRLHIDELDVLRTHQGQGLGRRLLTHTIHHARSQGFRRLGLTTFRNIPWNAPFYASLGFHEWAPKDAPQSIRDALKNEAAFGLKDRCAMKLDL